MHKEGVQNAQCSKHARCWQHQTPLANRSRSVPRKTSSSTCKDLVVNVS